jgi:small subunit ribosomal protein S18|uniref:Small ribosomal subunit protein bS18c n=2 Tax=Chrysochromulina TaxID=35140 RepID=A0A075DWU7_9EUKA|nr:30S ribosomal protein S18 [Chrysochromulina parva]AHY04385.1 30S ribosomal protein S18 [Chrysochromulina tobinii]AUS84412.1 30S ribosomal protein S18 [Chrysochromulina parva]
MAAYLVNQENKENKEAIDFASLTYKDVKVLGNFLSDQGKILPRRVTGVTSKEQKKITKCIKTARIAALLPFVVGKA